MRLLNLINKYASEILVLLIGSLFGFFLFFQTFYTKGNTIFIASKAWSDFASHIPLIRSFSLGYNFPPEFPLFPGEPIKYHFIFYYIVGLLEKIGLPIDLALNIPSFLGFVFLIFMIYFFAKEIFKSKLIGILSVIFFLFNSTLSYVYFFQKYPLSPESFNQIIKNTNFLSFAPYGEGIISAFWNLNIYTNQRHLAISFGFSILIIYLALKPILQKEKPKLWIYPVLGIILGLSFYLHTAVFLMTIIILGVLFIQLSGFRKNIFILLILSAIFSLPQYLYLNSSQGFSPHIQFGYLVSGGLNIKNVLEFWIYNLGISAILIPLGFIFANKFQKKLLLSFFMLFIIGNTIQFSPEIAANHKFFNFFIILGNMFSALVIIKLIKKKLFSVLAILLLLLMIFGGIIDLFPIINDQKYELQDYQLNKDSKWILENTSRDSVFLNTIFLYNPASLSGRKIFLGWPYFAWSQGYDTYKRGDIIKNILGSNNKAEACSLLLENKIDYVEIKIQNPPDPNIPPISNLYAEEFTKTYENFNSNYSIYSIKENCGL